MMEIVLRRISIYFLLALVGSIDYLTGAEFHLGCLYLVVAALASWFLTPWAAALFTVVTAMAWATSEWLSGVHYSRNWLYVWNDCNDIGVVAITALMVSKAKHTLDQRQRLIQELGQTLLRNGRFKELLPVCRLCHEVHVDEEYRARLATFMREDAAEDVGNICSECLETARARVSGVVVDEYFQPGAP